MRELSLAGRIIVEGEILDAETVLEWAEQGLLPMPSEGCTYLTVQGLYLVPFANEDGPGEFIVTAQLPQFR